MSKNRIWLGIILSIILLVFSINGFTAYYKYTQESGTNFYVGTADKSDALEDTNEMRQIIDDLGALLVHDKRNDLYPKDATTGGTIQIPETGLKFSNDPVNDDIAAYIAGEMMWQTKAELGLDLSLYYLKTAIDTQGEVETIWGTTLCTDAELTTALTDYYLKTDIDTLGEVETIYTKDIIDSDELAALKFTDLADTPAAYDNGKYAKSTVDGVVWDDPTGAGDMLKTTYDTDEDGDIDVAAGGTEKSSWTLYAIPYLSGTTAFGEITIGTAGQVLKVSAGATGYEFANESDPTVDTDAEIKAILVDEITKTGAFTAGRMAIINNASGIIEQGTNTDTDVADAVTKKHAANADTDLDGTFEATFVKKTDTVNVLSDITSTGANIEDAVTKKHTQNTDTQFDFYNALGSDHLYSGDKDTQLVGESVVFGDLLYFNWTDKEWKKTDADAAATMPGLRIALETKADGETCLMLVKGYIRDDSAFEFAGAMIYTSVTPGAMSSTAPTETGDQVQRVGVAKSADILFFDPSIDVGEI